MPLRVPGRRLPLALVQAALVQLAMVQVALVLAGTASPALADTLRQGTVEPGPRVIALLDASPQTTALGAALEAFGFRIEAFGRPAGAAAAGAEAARYGVRAEATAPAGTGLPLAPPLRAALVDTLTQATVAVVEETASAGGDAAYASAASAIADVWMGQ